MIRQACLLPLLLACVPRAAPAEAAFPFPVDVDEAKGKTGAYPNRVRDRDRGIWYVLVPGGKYRIGTDKLEDSRSIEIELSTFYISQSRVTKGQAAAWIEKDTRNDYVPVDSPQFRALVQGTSSGDLQESLKGLSPDQRSDALLVINVWGIARYGIGSLFSTPRFKPSEALLKRAEPFAVKAEAGGIGGAAGKPVRLTDNQRTEARSLCAAFEKELDTFMRRYPGSPAEFRPRTWSEAFDVAKELGVSLPTEAQWEAAARLHQEQRIKLRGLFDGTLEWCSDRYAYDYFHRRSDFKDPAGPVRGRLSAEQLESIGSSLGVAARLSSRRFRVLRGGDAPTRFYGYHGDRYPNAKGVRLAFTP